MDVLADSSWGILSNFMAMSGDLLHSSLGMTNTTVSGPSVHHYSKVPNFVCSPMLDFDAIHQFWTYISCAFLNSFL